MKPGIDILMQVQLFFEKKKEYSIDDQKRIMEGFKKKIANEMHKSLLKVFNALDDINNS
ncbi:hypothetical protein FGF1_19910 [Flavobacteriaceae bacterium GF1]